MASEAAKAKNRKQLVTLRAGGKKFSQVKFKNRCNICGRPRGYIRRFGMCRICFRKAALNGDLPGVKKIAW